MKKLAIVLISIATLILSPLGINAEENSYTLFYSNENATDVSRVETTVSLSLKTKEELYSLLFYKLKEIPSTPGLHPAVPNNIQLKDIKFANNGTIYLDFNDEVMNIGSRSAEFVFIKAVNYTYFTNFKDINHIYYTVNGTMLSSLSHIDVSEGFSRDTTK